jgi:hypothetical protein
MKFFICFVLFATKRNGETECVDSPNQAQSSQMGASPWQNNLYFSPYSISILKTAISISVLAHAFFSLFSKLSFPQIAVLVKEKSYN